MSAQKAGRRQSSEKHRRPNGVCIHNTTLNCFKPAWNATPPLYNTDSWHHTSQLARANLRRWKGLTVPCWKRLTLDIAVPLPLVRAISTFEPSPFRYAKVSMPRNQRKWRSVLQSNSIITMRKSNVNFTRNNYVVQNLYTTTANCTSNYHESMSNVNAGILQGHNQEFISGKGCFLPSISCLSFFPFVPAFPSSIPSSTLFSFVATRVATP